MIDVLRERHPWPNREPIAPEDWHGWLNSDTHAMLYRYLNVNTKVVVECGSWLGMSTRAILFGAPNATVICCDHWKGSPEQQADPDCARRLPTLYETFLRNLWPWRERIIPIRGDSLDAMAEIHQTGLVPDLIYLDTEHTYAQVTRELTFCTDHWPMVTIVGDDYHWQEVAMAANDHAQKTGRRLCGQGTAYSFLPPPLWMCEPLWARTWTSRKRSARTLGTVRSGSAGCGHRGVRSLCRSTRFWPGQTSSMNEWAGGRTSSPGMCG